MRKRRVVVALIDVAIWGIVVWLILRPYDPLTKARTAWHTTRFCWAIASWFGRCAIEAERKYYVEMERHK